MLGSPLPRRFRLHVSSFLSSAHSRPTLSPDVVPSSSLTPAFLDDIHTHPPSRLLQFRPWPLTSSHTLDRRPLRLPEDVDPESEPSPSHSRRSRNVRVQSSDLVPRLLFVYGAPVGRWSPSSSSPSSSSSSSFELTESVESSTSMRAATMRADDGALGDAYIREALMLWKENRLDADHALPENELNHPPLVVESISPLRVDVIIDFRRAWDSYRRIASETIIPKFSWSYIACESIENAFQNALVRILEAPVLDGNHREIVPALSTTSPSRAAKLIWRCFSGLVHHPRRKSLRKNEFDQQVVGIIPFSDLSARDLELLFNHELSLWERDEISSQCWAGDMQKGLDSPLVSRAVAEECLLQVRQMIQRGLEPRTPSDALCEIVFSSAVMDPEISHRIDSQSSTSEIVRLVLLRSISLCRRALDLRENRNHTINEDRKHSVALWNRVLVRASEEREKLVESLSTHSKKDRAFVDISVALLGLPQLRLSHSLNANDPFSLHAWDRPRSDTEYSFPKDPLSSEDRRLINLHDMLLCCALGATIPSPLTCRISWIASLHGCPVSPFFYHPRRRSAFIWRGIEFGAIRYFSLDKVESNDEDLKNDVSTAMLTEKSSSLGPFMSASDAEELVALKRALLQLTEKSYANLTESDFGLPVEGDSEYLSGGPLSAFLLSDSLERFHRNRFTFNYTGSEGLRLLSHPVARLLIWSGYLHLRVDKPVVMPSSEKSAYVLSNAVRALLPQLESLVPSESNPWSYAWRRKLSAFRHAVFLGSRSVRSVSQHQSVDSSSWFHD